MNRSKQKGTAWESDIVNFLTRLGLNARRVVLHGKEDQGDIHIEGFPVIIEAKNEKTYKISEWLTEAKKEAFHRDPLWYGLVWAHRQGKAKPEDGFVIMDGETAGKLLLYIQDLKLRAFDKEMNNPDILEG